MDESFLQVVYDTEAQMQFDYLVNLDFSYIDEPDKYERLLAAVPEQVGLEMGHAGKTYYVHLTKQGYLGPRPLWISYFIERNLHRVRIFDIRQHPTK
jgi:hypothetical protein